MEAIQRETYQPSGSKIRQMTSAPALHSNIYCEVPYMDSESRYVLFNRSNAAYGAGELWRADLLTDRLTLVFDGKIARAGIAIAPSQQRFWNLANAREDYCELISTDIVTFEQQVFEFRGLHGPLASLGTIAPDEKNCYSAVRLGTTADHKFGILKFDLVARTIDIIHEGGDDLCNTHVQVELGGGQDLLIQHNRGAEFDDAGVMLKLVDDPWCTLYVIDVHGKNLRRLPVGVPYTDPCQGHQSWISDTGEILLTTGWDDHDGIFRNGWIWRVRPGDEKPTLISKAYAFSHPNASKDGRFFVSDTYPDSKIVVGSIKTGRTRVLCESKASFGRPQYTHPHPYYSPDRKWVIFNSDRTGLAHIYAATVPAGLLEELEES